RQVSFSTLVARQLATGKGLKELYDWFVNALNETFHYYHSQLYHYDEAANSVTLVAASGSMAQELVGKQRNVEDGPGLLDRALATRDAVLHTENDAGSEWKAPRYLAQANAALAIPILLGDALLGAVVVYSVGRSLGDDDHLLLQGLSAQLATAIEGMR